MFSRLHIFIIIEFLSILSARSHDRDDSLNGKWKFSAYAEAFITLSSSVKRDSKISNFQFNHNRYNSPNINQAHIGVDHESSKMRLQLAFQAGTYVKDNYAAEPALLQPIYKCFVGFPVNRKKNMWIDAGVFPSYIGFESVEAFSNSTLTRSLCAENSPYFLTGVRMNHPISSRSELGYFLLTGWQRIVPVKGNSLPAFGFQWIRRFGKENHLNWSLFAGSDYPDSLRRMRYFNNFYWQGGVGRWRYTIGLDIGFEQKVRRSREYNVWWSPVLIARYSFSEKWNTAFRLEHYGDKSGVNARPANGLPAVTTGYSLNMDYEPFPFLLCRAEWRRLRATREVFPFENGYRSSTGYFTFSLACRFERLL